LEGYIISRRSVPLNVYARKRSFASLIGPPLNCDPNYECILFIHSKQNQHSNIYSYTSLRQFESVTGNDVITALPICACYRIEQDKSPLVNWIATITQALANQFEKLGNITKQK
jgi:hypothetical protein